MSDYLINTYHLHSADVEEVSDFIKGIYAENSFTAHSTSGKQATISGLACKDIGLFDVLFEMQFVFKSYVDRQNYLILLCNGGGGTCTTQKASAQYSAGNVLPVSLKGEYQCASGQDGLNDAFLILDADRVHDFVSQWIGRPIETPIQFDVRPVSSSVNDQWRIAVNCLQGMLLLKPTPDAAIHALLEHMLQVMIIGHPNNYSAILEQSGCVPECKVRAAIGMIMEDPMRWRTLGAIAYTLGCATNALEKGVRKLSAKGSADLFYSARMHCLNRALAGGSDRSFVEILRAFGFSISERFLCNYKKCFGESPSATYRKNTNAEGGLDPPSSTYYLLCERIINDFIDASLGKPIGLSDLARLVNMSEYATIAAFKEQFSQTPMQYVIGRRLERAQWLLRHTCDSITSIAIDCGFGAQSYLTTTMKKRYGATPNQIRLTG